MKLVVGLGNPGKRYAKTRHNVGFMVLDKLNVVGQWSESKKGRLLYHWTQKDGEKVEFIKPLTFMNESGYSVSYVKRKHRDLDLNDLYVVHDDLDVKLGEYKIQKGKGPKEHLGLLSVYEKLGTKDFWHVRIGVDSRPQTSDNRLQAAENISGNPSFAKAIEGRDYVLQKFTDDEMKIVDQVTTEIVKDLMGRLNSQ